MMENVISPYCFILVACYWTRLNDNITQMIPPVALK